MRVIRALLLETSSRRALRFGPAIAWTVTIFVLSSIPGDRYPHIDVRFADKWAHAGVYAILGYLYARAAQNPDSHRFTLYQFAAAWGAGILYGALDELHQLLIPRRSCSLSDWIVDIIFVAIGAGLWVLRGWIRSRQRVSAGVEGTNT